MIWYYLFVLIIGLCIGSFLNVVLLRLDRKEGIMTGRSECPHCSHQLNWKDLVPLFSYLFLRGSCRYCRAEISSIYPAVELITATVILIFFMVAGPAIQIGTFYYLVVIVLFLLLAFFDAMYLILPDKITFFLIVFAFLFNMVFGGSELLNVLLSGFIFGLAFAIIYLVSHGQWMGFGDVKLVIAIGLVLGYPLGFFSIISAIWIAAIWGLVLMASGKANLKTALPFGSFLSATTILFIIFKDVIIEKINIYQYFL